MQQQLILTFDKEFDVQHTQELVLRLGKQLTMEEMASLVSFDVSIECLDIVKQG